MGNSEKLKSFSTLVLICFAVFTFISALPASENKLAVFTKDHGIHNNNEQAAKAFLSEYNIELEKLTNIAVLADWEYNTNLTEENAEKSIAAGLAITEFNAAAFEVASQFDTTNFTSDTTRQLSKVGKKSLSDEEMKNLSSIISQMGQIYGEGKVCRDTKHPLDEECLSLEPDLTKLMAESRNASELLWAWQGWRVNVARRIKPLYLEYVDLKNKLARENGYEDYGDELRKKYETPSFESDIRNLYDEMKPLYLELHAYIRKKLYETYGPDVVDVNGTLPQHLLGDMWGRFWTNLYSIGVPFPDRPSMDVTPALIKQNYTVRRMFETGDEFYRSMGLIPVPSTFFNLSMLEKPDDREVICHATAWDFYDKRDFRIKMCTNINYDDFLTIHHELGHVQYFMQYANQPTVYRDGSNDGFHEAIGELMSMCVSTPKHLYTIGLLDNLLQDNETTINYLFQQSLSTLSALPFHYLNDLWRWKAFRGDFPDRISWNDEFWKLAEEIVGVHAPVQRSLEDLDCPAIYHVAQDYDMIRYFTRTILQFQFAESLCRTAGHEGPLNECDFYGSTEAGEKLAAMLQMGASKPWPDALEALTGTRQMNARAIREYFAPLEKWLHETNLANGDTPGWSLKRVQTQEGPSI